MLSLSGKRGCFIPSEQSFKYFVSYHQGRRRFGKPKNRWVDNIKMDLTERGWEWMGWIHI